LAASARRSALVLGNGAYSHKWALPNPKNDAVNVAAALKALRFQVTSYVDLGIDKMEALIDGFIAELEKQPADLCVIYYSGHGLQLKDDQLKDTNFLVPTDFDRYDPIRLVSVQDLIDRVAHCSRLQVILLDACRKGFEGARDLRPGVRALAIGERAIYVGTTPVSGLAEMRASANTFIAFAAAPGDVAIDSVGSSLSPFTEAFLTYVDVVDLPLLNLMARVRHDVKDKTGGRQRTWDHSSLIEQVYFNPGSMFLLMGNALALFGLLLSILPYSLALASPERSWDIVAMSAVLPLMSLAIIMYGIQTAYSRAQGNFDFDKQDSVARYLRTCLVKGVLGGYLGSLIASLIVTVIYYRDWLEAYNRWVIDVVNGKEIERVAPPMPLGELALEIAIAGAMAACVLGILSLFFSRVSLHLRGFRLAKNLSDTRILSGAAVGGTIAGATCVAIGMMYFSQTFRPKLMPPVLLSGAVLGASVIVFSIVNFDFERLSLRRLSVGGISAVAALVVGGLFTQVLFSILAALGVVDSVVSWISENDKHYLDLALGGAVYGIPTGLALGAVIGLAMVFTDRLSRWLKRAAGDDRGAERRPL
jgi:Caspase domain